MAWNFQRKFQQKVSLSFTKFHKVSSSFNKWGKLKKPGYHLGFSIIWSGVDPKLVFFEKKSSIFNFPLVKFYSSRLHLSKEIWNIVFSFIKNLLLNFLCRILVVLRVDYSQNLTSNLLKTSIQIALVSSLERRRFLFFIL